MFQSILQIYQFFYLTWLDVIEEYASGKRWGDEDVQKSCVNLSFWLCQGLRDEYVKIAMTFKNGVSVW